MNRVTVADMPRHIEELATAHEIMVDTRWVKRADKAYAWREVDGGTNEIQIPPIRSAISYATALHEIGHILGRHQNSRRSLVRERWAWRWARANAIEWTPVMERCAVQSLAALAPSGLRAPSAGRAEAPGRVISSWELPEQPENRSWQG
jgi:antirestriction protein ArdC